MGVIWCQYSAVTVKLAANYTSFAQSTQLAKTFIQININQITRMIFECIPLGETALTKAVEYILSFGLDLIILL